MAFDSIDRPGRRTWLAAAACAVASPFAAMSALAQAWPSKAIRIINPYTPGSSSDLTARIWAQLLGDFLQATIIVESKPGATGSLGATYVVRSEPDGYTLLLAPKDIVVLAPLLKRKLPYDPEQDLAPINKVIDFPIVMTCRSELKVENVQGLIKLAKAKPGQLRFTSAGIGSSQHLAMEIFMRETGTSLQHIPYQGGGPALLGLLRGDGDVMVASEALQGPAIREGKLVALASTGKQRSPTLPNVPTIAEAGVPRLNLDGWYGLFARKGTPEAILQRISEGIAHVSASPEYRHRIASFGGLATQMDRAGFQQSLGEEKRYWGAAIKSAGIEAQDF